MNARAPAHLSVYIDVLGTDLGVKFLLAFGGSYVSLSERPQERSSVAELVGRDLAIALARKIGSGSRRIPTGKPFIARHLQSEGLNVNQIARRLHVTDVTVRNWLTPPDTRQMSLL